MSEEAALCRGALRRIAAKWRARSFEIRPTNTITFSTNLQLGDSYTDMLRQALRALQYLEQDGTPAQLLHSSRRSKQAADQGRERLLRMVDEDLQSSVVELEKQVSARAAYLDRQRSVACSHVRQDVAQVLACNGRCASVEDETGFKAAAAAGASGDCI